MSDPETYRVFIEGQLAGGKPPAELWPAAKRFLGAEEAERLLGVPEPAGPPRPVPAKRERSPRPEGPAPDKPMVGVGAEYIVLTVQLHIPMCRACLDLAIEMTDLGVDGCEREFDRLATELRSRAKKFGWWAKRKAEVLAVTSGLAKELDDWSDPAVSMLRLAIKRAKEKEEAGRPPADPPV